MVVGNPATFAIESEITKAFEKQAFRALGFFVLWVSGTCYGVKEPTSMLAGSFNDVVRRLAKRGTHNVPIPTDATATSIAHAYMCAIYADCEDAQYFGMSEEEFGQTIRPSGVVWAPDSNDEAFDDGSYMLHFDCGQLVRLIAFKSVEDPIYDLGSLREIRLPESEFYDILKSWKDKFDAEWSGFPKTSF